MSDNTVSTSTPATSGPSSVDSPSKQLEPSEANKMIPTTFGSVEEFRNASPDVYEAMCQGIAQSVMRQMEDHKERQHQMFLEAQADSKRTK